jgi:hypothetical protein
MVLRFPSRSPRGPGSLAPVACKIIISRKLDISVGISGPHDFAVRFAGAPVLRTQSVHRIPHSTFVTTRNAPPDERGTGLALVLFLPNQKAENFLQESWTGRQISAVATIKS